MLIMTIIMMIMRMMGMIHRDQQLPRDRRGFTTSVGTCSLFTISISGLVGWRRVENGGPLETDKEDVEEEE